MTSRLPLPSWAGFLFLLILVPVQIVRSTFWIARDLARSTYKGILKRFSHARRRRTNNNADTKDIATHNPKPEVTERNQLHASIFKLPLELRQQIYDLHFEQRVFFMREIYDHGYRLYAPTRLPAFVPFHLRSPTFAFDPAHTPRRLNGLLYLPLVCRQFYCEATEYLYRKSTFSFDDYNEALLLPSLAIFPKKHLDTLRSLELRFCIDVLVKKLGLGTNKLGIYYKRAITSWKASLSVSARQRRRWAAFWTFLAALPNLRRLRVTFTRLPGPGSPAEDIVFWRIIAPLLQFNKRERLEMFDVVWHRETKAWDLTGGWSKTVPFRMVWIPGGMGSNAV